MNFDYEVEDEDGNILATVTVTAEFAPEVEGFVSGRPERCYPASGGELVALDVYLGDEDVTATVDERFGPGTYERLARKAKAQR